MGYTIIEKIISQHCDNSPVKPGDIVDVKIDARVARDFGGANVVRNIQSAGLEIDDPSRTYFTFDCNPTGSDQKYAENQQVCRVFARERDIRVFDIDQGIGTHILIEEGLAFPGTTAVSTDSHANILGAVGAFGQGMGDKDIAATWVNGKVWFKTPPSARIELKGHPHPRITAKDIVLNLLDHFGSSELLGYSVELYGEFVDNLKLDERITIASMATELGAIIILIPPSNEVIRYCEARARKKITAVFADDDASYDKEVSLDLSEFKKLISRPGKPHDTTIIPQNPVWIDSAFIGSCTNGRLRDLEVAACILKGKKIAQHVVLKVVPATDKVWQQALEAGYIEDLKAAGAMISNAGCAGCAAGQVGQNGPGEVTISTGNRNFPGKQGKGEVYLASPDIVAASAIAGFITKPDDIPEKIPLRPFTRRDPARNKSSDKRSHKDRATILEGRARIILIDDIDTDMIFHNSYLTITDEAEMGKHTFGNLEGYNNFAKTVEPGDIVITGRNFGAGSSRQQAVDCFKSLGVNAIIAESFGSIYERNAINVGFPILSYVDEIIDSIQDNEQIQVDLCNGKLTILSSGKVFKLQPFSEVQMEIYKNNGLF